MNFLISIYLLSNRKVFITNVIPGDFNSDGHLDALLSYHNKTKDQTLVNIFLGKDGDKFGMSYI